MKVTKFEIVGLEAKESCVIVHKGKEVDLIQIDDETAAKMVDAKCRYLKPKSSTAVAKGSSTQQA